MVRTQEINMGGNKRWKWSENTKKNMGGNKRWIWSENTRNKYGREQEMNMECLEHKK